MHDAKTKNGRRTIPLTTKALEILRRQRIQKQKILFKGIEAEEQYRDLVFVTKNNRPTQQFIVQEVICSIVNKIQEVKIMEAYKQEFIEFMVESQVLKFGDFTLKSGRKSPFFMNAGGYVTGSQLKRLGEYYAKAIHDKYGDDFDVLFGPAYKGIPLAVVTAMAYSELYGKEVRYCSDRKEEKDHGADKGSFLGSKLKDGDRVIMIEDVTTSGKSMEETVPKVKGAADVTIVGLMVSLNRMEFGKSQDKCALDEVKELYGFDTAAIVDMSEVVEYLYNKECQGKVLIDDTMKKAIDDYYALYGVK